MLPLTVPELRRLLLAVREPPERFRFRLAWSYWRRRHQAIAKRCHQARRARRPLLLRPVPLPTALPAPSVPDATLSEAQWQRVLPLLPPQRPPRGRPYRDHRPLVAAMVWVEQTGRPWSAVPRQCGPWKTVHSRYQQWRRNGLWAQIRAALADQTSDQPEVVAA